jgi:hypothetical protein
MTVQDSRALLVLVILVLSILIWVGSWVNFIVKARKTRSVDNRAIRHTSMQIGIGAFLSGFLIVMLGLVLQPPPSGGIPAEAYVFLFTICPGMLVLAVLVGFLRIVVELRSKYQLPTEPEDDE